MPQVEEYLEHADDLAQELVKPLGLNMRACSDALFTHEFNAQFDIACRYVDAKEVPDNRRQFNMLSERDAAEGMKTRQAFAAAYKIFWEKHQAAAQQLRQGNT